MYQKATDELARVMMKETVKGYMTVMLAALPNEINRGALVTALNIMITAVFTDAMEEE